MPAGVEIGVCAVVAEGVAAQVSALLWLAFVFPLVLLVVAAALVGLEVVGTMAGTDVQALS